MKRNIDLLRDILLRLEAAERLAPGDNPEEEKHKDLLLEAGYVEGSAKTLSTGYKLILLDGITMKGYDFLDSIRDKNVIEKIKNKLKTLEGVSLTVIKDLAVSIIKGE